VSGVLVHGTGSTTYAAQTNLTEDDRHEPVEHPLLSAFFTVFTGVAYVRNNVPWPGEWNLDDSTQ